MSQQFTESERQRFHNLLKMGAESPFEGERENAIAAAQRLAAKRGMTLEEAAAGEAGNRGQATPQGRPHWTEAELARFIHMFDSQLRADKARRDAALRAARARGLDAEERRKAATTRRTHFSRVRMNPYRHARTLLTETSLPFREVADITGLDIYQVVGLKLKLRSAA